VGDQLIIGISVINSCTSRSQALHWGHDGCLMIWLTPAPKLTTQREYNVRGEICNAEYGDKNFATSGHFNHT